MKPWEQYAGSAPAAKGPWARYAGAGDANDTAEVSAPQEPAYDPLAGESRLGRVAIGAGKSVSDTGRGLTQRYAELAAQLESVLPGAQAINRMLGSKGAASARDRLTQDAAEAKRLDAPLTKDPWAVGGNIAGGVAMAAPLAPLGPVGMGAATGFAQPTTAGPDEVLQNMGLGAATGKAGDMAMRGLGRVIQPRVRPEVRTLLDAGVTPTPGQIIGGTAARVESKATSLPLVGDAIASAQRRAGADLNRAAFNRALAPVGQQLPRDVPLGRQAVQYVDDALGARYDALLPRMTVRADQQFAQQVHGLRQMVNTGSLDPRAAQGFNRILNNDVLGKFRGQQALTGQTLKDIESDLGAHIRRLAGSTDADQRLVGDALQELQSTLRGLVQRSNPQHARELGAINTGWANFKRVQRAAGGLGAEDGIFTPAQLQNAVRALDRSKDHARFAEGRALMQDLSDPAKAVLGSKYPDSGTAGRLMNVGALASGLHTPAIPLGLGVSAGLYSAPAQRLIAGLLTQRPAGAQLLASQVEELAPLMGLLGSSAALSQR